MNYWKKVRNQLIFIALAVPLGIAAGSIAALFGRVLLYIGIIRDEYIYFLLPFLGAIGVLILWSYQKFGGRSSKGMTLLFEAGHGSKDVIPLRLIPFVIMGTWLTHLFGGSAGREGVAVQIGGTLGHSLGRRLSIENGEKILLITGMAAGFSGLFRTPLAATFFAIEVLTVGVLEYKALLPALTAAFTASYISGVLGLEKFSHTLSKDFPFSPSLLFKLLVLGVLFGIIGRLFSYLLHRTKRFFSEKGKNPLLRILIAGTAIGLLSLLCFQGRYSGLGTNLISMSLNEGVYSWDFALKFLFTVLTLSVGFQGGEVTPLFSIGATLGAFLASLLGLPVAFAAALGYAAVFGSASNTLFAPILIGMEVFGPELLPYFIAVCGLAYACNGNLSIYPLQKKKR
jgi:H+/Cl- antiporter ClcA